MAHKKLWHAMTNIGAINSRHIKTYGVTKIMDCHKTLWSSSHNQGTPKGLSHAKDYNSQNSNMNYFFSHIRS
jgi:hypothetical protein